MTGRNDGEWEKQKNVPNERHDDGNRRPTTVTSLLIPTTDDAQVPFSFSFSFPSRRRRRRRGRPRRLRAACWFLEVCDALPFSSLVLITTTIRSPSSIFQRSSNYYWIILPKLDPRLKQGFIPLHPPLVSPSVQFLYHDFRLFIAALSMHISNHHLVKRQGAPSIPTDISGFTGVNTATSLAVSGGPLVFDSTAPPAPAVSAPSLENTGSLIITSTPPPSSPTPSSSPLNPSASSHQDPDADAAASAASKNNNDISIGTVVGACVGAFAGLLVVICLYVWFNKRHNKWKASLAASDARNAHGRAEQRRSRGRSWNKLQEKGGQDTWEGMTSPNDAGGAAGAGTAVAMTMVAQDEKQLGISNLFKKSPSMRTTRTTKTISDEDNASYGLPPFEFSQYHPDLAVQLALEQPGKPFAKREDSGISWDGDTVADDTVMSLRSGSARVDSGTMSPTFAKMCPPATPFTEHKWESAEVLHMEEDTGADNDNDAVTAIQNPFADVIDEKRKSSSANNPFFNARDLQRSVVRSRSGSIAAATSYSRVSRAYSRSSRMTTSTASPIEFESVPSTPSTIRHPATSTNPFLDPIEGLVTRSPTTIVTPLTVPPPAATILQSRTHTHNDSVASDSSDKYNSRAMRTLIAALDIPQADVEARLRVALSDDNHTITTPSIMTMTTPSISSSAVSMRSSFSQASSLYTADDGELSDIGTVRNFPMPPSPPPPAHHPPS